MYQVAHVTFTKVALLHCDHGVLAHHARGFFASFFPQLRFILLGGLDGKRFQFAACMLHLPAGHGGGVGAREGRMLLNTQRLYHVASDAFLPRMHVCALETRTDKTC